MNSPFQSIADRLSKKQILGIQITLIVAAVILLAFIAIPLSLMNSYTTGGYAGWQETAVPGIGGIMLPADWQLTVGAAPGAEKPAEWLPVTIARASGEEIARGYLFPAGLTNEIFRAAALDLTGMPLTEYRILSNMTTSLFSRGGSLHEGVFFSGEEIVRRGYCIKLASRPAELHLWFTDLPAAEVSVLQEQYKAILWSLLF